MSRTKRFTDTEADELVERIKAGETLQGLAREFSCSPVTVRNSVRRRGLTDTSAGLRHRQRFSDDEARVLAERNRAGESLKALAREMGVNEKTLTHTVWRVSDHDTFKGWRASRHQKPMRTSGGYLAAHVDDDDPMHCMARKKGGYVLEHRLVMARFLGRPLRDDESVHHINGQRDDNRLENLQLRTGNHGKHAVFECADCGSANVVPRQLM